MDFVTYEELKSVEKALKKIYFKRTGRCFSHTKCPRLIDFVNPPIAIGHEPIRPFEILKSSAGSLKLLTPTDSVKDRLASYFYWKDEQALEQGLLVAKNNTINSKDLKRWAKEKAFSPHSSAFWKNCLRDCRFKNNAGSSEFSNCRRMFSIIDQLWDDL